MRRRSVADEATAAERARVGSLSASDRVRLALELGRRSLELHCSRTGESAERARRRIERRVQARRRASACLAGLLA
jgi:hypothetical protein